MPGNRVVAHVLRALEHRLGNLGHTLQQGTARHDAHDDLTRSLAGESRRKANSPLTMPSLQAPPEPALTCLINDLDAAGRQIALALDDYQFINSQAVHVSMSLPAIWLCN